jgi:hypothetical protein
LLEHVLAKPVPAFAGHATGLVENVLGMRAALQAAAVISRTIMRNDIVGDDKVACQPRLGSIVI